jgi:UPF0042 nucleotide-binding protein
MLAPLKQRADWVVDSSRFNVHELRAHIIEQILPQRTGGMIVTVNFFGYKYGTPLDADLVFDIRFLPNPNYVPELKMKTGMDQDVKDYIFRGEVTSRFLEKLAPLLDFMLEQYVSEGKSSLVIGVGCTGGRHRSVAVAEWLADRYRSGDYDYNVVIRHRDIDKNR